MYWEQCSINHLTRLKVQTYKQLHNQHTGLQMFNHRAQIPLPVFFCTLFRRCRTTVKQESEHKLELLITSRKVTYFNAALAKKNPQKSHKIWEISNNIPLKWAEVLVHGGAIVADRKRKGVSEREKWQMTDPQYSAAHLSPQSHPAPSEGIHPPSHLLTLSLFCLDCLFWHVNGAADRTAVWTG